MDLLKTIVQQLPYTKPFHFVDALTAVDEDGCEGSYLFQQDEYFYQGHFKDNPVTPGVILTECMAQIGLVCLGVYLVESSKVKSEKLKVKGEKLKVKGSVTLSDSDERGIVSKGGKSKSKNHFVFSESNVLFEKAVYPGEKVKVVSQKIYWRLGKLKCRVEMFNEAGERVCFGELSGIIKSEK